MSRWRAALAALPESDPSDTTDTIDTNPPLTPAEGLGPICVNCVDCVSASEPPPIAKADLDSANPANWRSLPYGPERARAFAAARLLPNACGCCVGVRWWQEAENPMGWRCATCHPPDGLRAKLAWMLLE